MSSLIKFVFRYDEWITEDSIVSLVTRSSKKKGTLLDPPKDVKVLQLPYLVSIVQPT